MQREHALIEREARVTAREHAVERLLEFVRKAGLVVISSAVCVGLLLLWVLSVDAKRQERVNAIHRAEMREIARLQR